jgi:biotin carboxyl carrier protein
LFPCRVYGKKPLIQTVFKQQSMSIEIKVGNRLASVELIRQEGNILDIKIDDIIYNVDVMHTTQGTFSIIHNGHSYNIELDNKENKKYTAFTLYRTFDIEVIDAETRYINNRGGSGFINTENTITSPMPGKVVKILFAEGDAVKKGETVIVISAMKMESEYKSPMDGVINRIGVKEGDTVDSNQVLIEIE